MLKTDHNYSLSPQITKKNIVSRIIVRPSRDRTIHVLYIYYICHTQRERRINIRPPLFSTSAGPTWGWHSLKLLLLLLLLLLLSTNLYSAPNTPLTSGTLHTKHRHNTKQIHLKVCLKV